MEEAFWQERWETGQIGFHEGRPNSMLSRHLDRLELKAGQTIFVPLCGKAIDLNWLLGKGFKVIGAEFNESAVREVFEREGDVPEPKQVDALKRYQSGDLTIFVGDIFDLTAERLGPVHAVYDRAALVALPEDIRKSYAAHLMELTDTAKQLAVVFDYNQSTMEGPPFSVSTTMVRELYAGHLSVTELEAKPIRGPMAERVDAMEVALLLG